jgi:hypothetical protein
VVFASRTQTDRPIWYSFSKDGETWTAATPLMRGASGFSPWVAGGDPGEAAIAWYGSPTPMSSLGESVDWYFYRARVSGADTTAPVISAGTTTEAPIFQGTSAIPEFEMVRLDAQGRMHIGMSAFRKKGGSAGWSIYYQREILPLVTGGGTVPGAGGPATFAVDARRDDAGLIAGTLTYQDPGAGVSITARTFETLLVENVTGGLSCSISGLADVVVGGSTTSEPFSASCQELAAGESFSIQTSSYQGGGTLSAGALRLG